MQVQQLRQQLEQRDAHIRELQAHLQQQIAQRNAHVAELQEHLRSPNMGSNMPAALLQAGAAYAVAASAQESGSGAAPFEPAALLNVCFVFRLLSMSYL